MVIVTHVLLRWMKFPGHTHTHKKEFVGSFSWMYVAFFVL
jgi:hypothetical protein